MFSNNKKSKMKWINKTFVERLLTSKVLLMLAFFTSASAMQHLDPPPNVIIIYTDDQGTVDANCYGARDLHTPNMDLLAETGVRFSQFYSAAPVCSPSRAALLTGRTPLAVGLPGNAPSHKGGVGLASEQVIIAEKLKENGYVTGHVGKWHVGYTPETMPNGQGFDYSFGHMGGCIDNYSHFFYWHGPNRHDLWENNEEIWRDGEYFQDLMSDKVNTFLEENQDTTFFLYYALNLPHYPLQGTNKWRQYYQDMESPRNMYAACISTVDERIGYLLQKLESLGLRENTIIIFQSDHGHSMEERTFSGGGSSGPYRGAKFSLFEGGIRVPAIISWPGTLPSNVVRDQMSVNVDWFPTILDLCNIDYHENTFEGKSMRKVIFENATSRHDAFWWYSRENRWAVRKGDWKLLKNPIDPSSDEPITESDSLFLVNIHDDPGESFNLASKYPEMVEELKETYETWYQKWK